MAYDRDGFVRYEAANRFGIETLEAMMSGAEVNKHYIESYGAILEDETIEAMFKAQLLELPTITMLMQRQKIIDVSAIAQAQEKLKQALAERYFDDLKRAIEALYDPNNTDIDGESMGKRSLKNRLLGF